MKKTQDQQNQARFKVNGDNTITDRKTGLLIIQNPSVLKGFDTTLTYQQALDAIKSLNQSSYAGFSDWRLPTVEELCGMIDRARRNPCYDTGVFKGKFDDWYWAGDHCAYSGCAWCVTAIDGYVSYDGKDSRNYVRPVRTIQSGGYV